MDGGALTEWLDVLAQASGVDSAGQPNGAWSVVGGEWASMRQLNGLETVKAGALAAVTTVSFRIRRRGTYTTAMRVVHEGVTYEITTVSPDRIHREYEDLVCRAVL